MTTKKPLVCPRCGAPVKHPPKMQGRWQDRVGPTTYTCGTVTSPDWAPPIYGKDCNQ